jgi:GNAT superfamily N-acetyltransferase
MNIHISTEPFDSTDARRLITALDEHLAGRYSPDQRFGPNLKPEHVGADKTAEVKRMYVEPELRGRGVAKEILEHLEKSARDLGVKRLVLETGIYQAEAIALYRRAGFSPVRCWGEYAESITSVCFEKAIEGEPQR